MRTRSRAGRASCPNAPTPEPSAGPEEDLLQALDAETREVLAKAYAPRSEGPINTMIRSLARFARRVPARTLFLQPSMRGDLAVEAHNEWTLCLWARMMAREVSVKTRRLLRAGTIEGRISLAKGLLSHKYGFQIAGEAPRLKVFLRLLRAQDPLGKSRRKRRGLRGKHLRRIWKQHAQVRQRSRAAQSAWAASTTAWHVLARGGELEAVRRKDLIFRRALKQGKGRRYAVLWLRPLKKRRGQAQPKLPQFIVEQEQPEEWEPYAALRRLAETLDSEGVGPEAPLFTAAHGKPMTTPRFRAQTKWLAALDGHDPKEFGAQSSRIGGATDVAPGGEMLLQAKGRWASDIGKIYSRMTRRAQIAASDIMFGSHSKDLEELFPDFAEPA